MQNKPKTPRAPQYDARLPFTLCYAIGLILLAALEILCYLIDPNNDYVLYGLALFAFYAIVGGAMLLAYLLRVARLHEVMLAAENMTTEIGDVFKYVIDLPYAISDNRGNVKVVNRALQDLLSFKSPICNVPLSTFCSISINDIMHSTNEPRETRFARALDAEGEVIPGAHGFHVRLGNDGRRYELISYAMRLRGQDYYMITFHDVSDYLELREKMERESPIVGYIVLDNLQELAQYVRVSHRSAASEIENILKEWASGMGGLLREYDRDKFLLVFSAEALNRCIEDNFSILNRVRQIKLGDNSFPVTISMGITTVGRTFSEREAAASAALDIALQRGGDQVAIKKEDGVTFFGGRVKTIQSNTSIISRVNSNRLCSLIAQAGNVIIMAHRNPDFDAIGACVGAARLAMCAGAKNKTEIHVVMNRECDDFRICAEHLGNHAIYDDLVVDAHNALDLVRSDSLLIIVDANNVNIVEAPDVVKNVANIAIIDHHRQYEVFDFAPVLSYIHPTASSASELISEMIEQSPYANMLRKEEATLLLAGIMLDTKNFTHSTGAQTFSAVHYLYEKGAHTNVTRLFFYETLDEMITASDFGSRTRIYRGRIAITWFNTDNSRAEKINERVAAAKAADRLMTIRGIDASFALVSIGNSVSISARSGDAINVQIIMEKLGGGGHFDMAGAQVKDTTLACACELLKAAIDDYLDNDEAERK
ncbi:MAG: DHH family phosphoesterase [Clostridia bacterium]|nr:DHH family phosphoesterase [Clostridia bacterium]